MFVPPPRKRSLSRFDAGDFDGAFPPRFDHRQQHLVQVLSSKAESGGARLPLTRDDIYRDAAEVLGR